MTFKIAFALMFVYICVTVFMGIALSGKTRGRLG